MAVRLLSPEAFEGQVDGEAVGLFCLASTRLRACFSNHGARLLQLIVPDRSGLPRDVVLGFDSLMQMQGGLPSLGAFIGRHANRIAHSRFAIGSRRYHLPANDGPHCLHGGPGGSRHRVFRVREHRYDRLKLSHHFRSADDGFPGAVELQLEYRLAESALIVSYSARVSGAPTPLSLSAHPFFNLEGEEADSALDHELQILADEFVPVDAELLPLGHFEPVAASAFDFRRLRPLREALAQGHPQLRHGAVRGFDHAYRLSGPAGRLRLQARLRAPGSGISMEVHADAPCLQFYSAASMDGSRPRHAGKHGRVHGHSAGLCLEPQQFPDAPNQPQFPSSIVHPGERVQGRIEYRFFQERAD